MIISEILAPDSLRKIYSVPSARLEYIEQLIMVELQKQAALYGRKPHAGFSLPLSEKDREHLDAAFTAAGWRTRWSKDIDNWILVVYEE